MKIVDKEKNEQYPVISASDVSLAGTDLNLNENLSQHLKKQDDNISKLQSNVKWLYKYGGVGSGSGSGGGSGSSDKEWSIYAAIADEGTDNFEKINDGEQKVFDGTKSTRKTLQVRINYHNNSLYRIKITNEGTSLFSSWQILSADNLYTMQVNVNLNKNSENGGLQITVEDTQTLVTKQLKMTYISSPYDISLSMFSRSLTTGADSAVSGDEYLLMSNRDKKPVFRLSYEIFLPFNNFSITAVSSPNFLGKKFESESGEVSDYTSPDGTTSYAANTGVLTYMPGKGGDYVDSYFDVEFPEAYLTNENAGTYEIKFTVKFTLSTSAAPVELQFTKQITIIPANLFLKISTANISQFLISSDTELPESSYASIPGRQQGLSKFNVMIYDGVKINPSPNYKVSVTSYYKKKYETTVDDQDVVTYDETWTQASLTSTVNMQMQVSTLLNAIDYNQTGIWKTVFTAVSEASSETYTTVYYTSVQPIETNLDWFDEYTTVNKQAPVVLAYSSFMRKSADGMKVKNIQVVESSPYASSPFAEGSSFGNNDGEPLNTALSYIETSRIQQKNTYISFYQAGLIPGTTNSYHSDDIGGAITETSGDAPSVLLSLSVQFSKINPTDSISGVIAKVYTSPYEKNAASVQPYYLTKYRFFNSGSSDSNEDKICIPSESFSTSEPGKYHLVQILFQYLGKTSDSSSPKSQYAQYIYVDGQLEANGSTIVDSITPIYGIELMNQQCSYNLIDLEIIKPNSTDGAYELNPDAIIYQYWQAYKMIYLSSDVLDTESLEYLLVGPTSRKSYQIKFDGMSVQLGDILNAQETIENTNYELLDNIAQRIGIPVLLLSRSSVNGDSSLQKGLWANILSASSSNAKFDGNIVDVYYSPGKKPLKKQTIDPSLQEKIGFSSVQFSIDPQGTSTLNDHIKNLQLKVTGTAGSESEGKTLMFSPNYSQTDKDTFLPESSWTLKADVVDSAHSNNTSIGKFVNKMCLEHYSPNNIFHDKHQKVCLQGMPCLVFISDLWTETEGGQSQKKTRIVFAGYYNFNLGRESYNNLAYNTKETIEDVLADLSKNEYGDNAPYFKWAASYASVRPELGVAEITDNVGYFDFSQWMDLTNLLFANSTGSNENAGYMYSKLVTGSSDKTILKQALQNLNKNISVAGYYIFNKLGKNFTNVAGQPTYDTAGNILTDSDGNSILTSSSTYDITKSYKIPNLVTNPRIQYQNGYKDGESTMSTFPIEYGSGMFSSYSQDYVNNLYDTANINSLVSLVCTREIGQDDTAEPITPNLNYQYTVIYYVVLLAFGLVDSILKNLNLKTWNLPTNATSTLATFYPMFYDMDTAMELNNSALQSISFMAALDYWSNNINKDTGYLAGATVMRDYWPQSDTEPGFDFPSSYLFAIAKYAYTILNTEEGSNSNAQSSISSLESITPQLVWARLRMADDPVVKDGESTKWGLLESVDYFMDNFFTSGFKNATEYFISLNYKIKYLYYNTASSSGFTFTPSKFHGSRKQRVKEWLENRIYFLDSIFNISKIKLNINKSSGTNTIEYSENEFAELPETIQEYLQRNENIPILHDAFSDQSGSETSSTGQRHGNAGTLEITVPNKTPLIVKNSQVKTLYFLNESSKAQNLLHIDNNGAAVIVPYGSTLWTDVSSIDVFACSPLYVHSENLEAVRLYNSGISSISSYNIVGSRIQLIELASPMYTKQTSSDIQLRNMEGTLSFSGEAAEKMSALTTVNIPRTKISLSLSGLPSLTDINVAGVQSSIMEVSQCQYLRNVVFEDARYGQNRTGHRTVFSGQIKIDGYNGSVYMSTVDCPTITIQCTAEDQSCFISGNNTLETVSLSGFKVVIIKDCPMLKTVVITDNANRGLYCEYLAVHQWTGDYAKSGLTDPKQLLINGSITDSNTNPYQCDLSGLTHLRSFSINGFAKNAESNIRVILPDSEVVLADEAVAQYSYNQQYYAQTMDSKTLEYSYTLVNSVNPVGIPASGALANISKMQYLKTSTENPLWIAVPGAFSGCSSFEGLTDTGSSLSNIKFGYPDSMPGYSMTSLASTFEGCSSMNFSVLLHFICKCVKAPEKITDLSRAFANCTKIEYTKDNCNTTYKGSFKFDEFTSVTNISGMYDKCTKVTAMTKEMLNFVSPAEDKTQEGWYLNMSGFISSSTIDIFSDTFEVIGKRLQSFYSGQTSSATNISFRVRNSLGNIVTDFNLAEFLNQFPNITELTSIEFVGITSLDLKNAFKNNPDLTNLSNVFNSVDNSKIVNINDLFKIGESESEPVQPIYHDKITFVSNSFNSGTGTPAEDIDLLNFFPWNDRLGNDQTVSVNVFGSSAQSKSNFNAWYRKLSGKSQYVGWWNLYQKYYSKLSTLASMFYNTYVEVEDDDKVFDCMPPEVLFYDPETETVLESSKENLFKFSTRVSNLSNMFTNFSVRQQTTEPDLQQGTTVNVQYIRPVRLWDDKYEYTIFDMFPHVTSAESAFSNMLFYEMLPPDFFRKRKLVNLGLMYWTNNLSYDVSQNAEMRYAIRYGYDRTMQNIKSCFSGSKFLTNNSGFPYFGPDYLGAPSNKISSTYPDNYITMGTDLSNSEDKKADPDNLPEYVYTTQNAEQSDGLLLTFAMSGETRQWLTTHWSVNSQLTQSEYNVIISNDSGYTEVYQKLESGKGSLIGKFNAVLATLQNSELAELKSALGDSNNTALVELDPNGYISYNGTVICHSGINFYDKSQTPFVLPGTYRAIMGLNDQNPFETKLYAYLPDCEDAALTVSSRKTFGTVEKLGHSVLHLNGRKISSYIENVNATTHGSFIVNPDVEASTISYSSSSLETPVTFHGLKVQPGIDALKNQAGWQENSDATLTIPVEGAPDGLDSEKLVPVVPGYAYPFCPPDLLSACAPDTSKPEFGDILSGLNIAGYIPEGFISHFTQNSTFANANLFSTPKILPTLQGCRYDYQEEKFKVGWIWKTVQAHVSSCAYAYIPDDLTSTMLVTNLFNFNLMLPEAPETYSSEDTLVNYVKKKIFFVFNTNSLSWAKLTSTSNILPNISSELFKDEPWTLQIGAMTTDSELQNLKPRQIKARIIKDQAWNSGETESTLLVGFKGHLRLVKPSTHLGNPQYSGLPIYYYNRTILLSGTIRPDFAGILEGRIFPEQSFDNLSSQQIQNMGSSNPNVQPTPIIQTLSDWSWIGTRLILPKITQDWGGKTVVICKGVSDSSNVQGPITNNYKAVTDYNASNSSTVKEKYENMGYNSSSTN